MDQSVEWPTTMSTLRAMFQFAMETPQATCLVSDCHQQPFCVAILYLIRKELLLSFLNDISSSSLNGKNVLLTFDHGYAALKTFTYVSSFELPSTGVSNARNKLSASIASYRRRLIYTYQLQSLQFWTLSGMSDLNKKSGCDYKQLFLSDPTKCLPTLHTWTGTDPATRLHSVFEYAMKGKILKPRNFNISLPKDFLLIPLS